MSFRCLICLCFTLICLTAVVSASAQAVYQIDCGGGASSPFAADQYSDGGSTASVGNSIDTSGAGNPAPQSVYQSARYGLFSYVFPGLTPNAAYTVRLHFCENWWYMAGGRNFNALINGTQVLTNYDIFADAGGQFKAVVRQFAATADGSGKITIQFTAGTTGQDHSPVVNGVEILTGGPGSTFDQASFVSQSVPSSMGAGQTYPVSVTMRNTGGSTWTDAASFHLGSQNPQDNTTWGLSRVSLPTGMSVAPGAQVTFSFTVTAPTAHGTYNCQWRVVHDGVQWFGEATPNVSVGVGLPPPATVTVTPGVNGQATVTWSAAAGANRYIVSWGPTGAGFNAASNSLYGVTSYTITGLSVNQSYDVAVQSGDDYSLSGYSSPTQHVTLSLLPPATVAVTPGDGQATVTWSAGAGANRYIVSWGPTGAGFNAASNSLYGVTSYTITGLSVNQSYDVAVQSGDDYSLSGYSSPTQHVNLALLPPSSLVPDYSIDGQVTLKWGAVPGADSYLVSWGPGSRSYSGGSGLIAGTTYTVTGLPAGQDYYIAVQSQNNGGLSGFSDEVRSLPDPLTASAASLTVSGGGATSSTITARALGGFSGVVNLSLSGVPAGAVCWFYPSSVTLPVLPVTSLIPRVTSNLYIYIPTGVPAGSYALTVTGVSGTTTKTAVVTVTVP